VKTFLIKIFKVRNKVNPTSGIITNVYCLISIAVRSLVRRIIQRICAKRDKTPDPLLDTDFTQDMRGDLDD